MVGPDGKGTVEIRSSTSFSQSRWQPPVVNFWKLNVDVAWSPTFKVGDLGWMLRNHLGGVYLTGKEFIPSCREVKTLEAWRFALVLRV